MAMTRLVLAALALAAAAMAQSATPQTPGQKQQLDRSTPHLLDDRMNYASCSYPDVRFEGCCRLRITIGADGKPTSEPKGQCTHTIFLPHSQACLKSQIYLPALKNGRPVPGVGDVVVQYVQPESELVSAMRALTGLPLRPRLPEFCEPRPGDLVSSLPHARG